MGLSLEGWFWQSVSVKYSFSLQCHYHAQFAQGMTPGGGATSSSSSIGILI